MLWGLIRSKVHSPPAVILTEAEREELAAYMSRRQSDVHGATGAKDI